MGVSPTMMSAYTVHVWRTRIIVCTHLLGRRYEENEEGGQELVGKELGVYFRQRTSVGSAAQRPARAAQCVLRMLRI